MIEEINAQIDFVVKQINKLTTNLQKEMSMHDMADLERYARTLKHLTDSMSNLLATEKR